MIRMRKQRPREESDLPKVTQRDGGRVGTRTKACGSSRHTCGPGVSSHLSQHGFLCALGPADKASHRAPTRRFPAPSPCPNPQERPRGQGPPPRSAAGAGDTPSPPPGCLRLRCHPRNSPALRPTDQVAASLSRWGAWQGGNHFPLALPPPAPRLTRQRSGCALNHSLPLEDAAFSGGCGDGGNGSGGWGRGGIGRGCLTISNGRNGGGSRGKRHLRGLLPSWICCVVLGESITLSGPQFSHL